MKIGTDAVLLGSWVSIPGTAGLMLDIGTGTGILALMLAQRSEALIDAIEINPVAATQAKENIIMSPWFNRVRVFEVSLQEFIRTTDHSYDFIICNPPYFSNALKSPVQERNLARHRNALPLHELLEGTFQLLSAHGTAAFIFPAESEFEWFREAGLHGLYPGRICHIFGKKGNKALRILVEFHRKPTPTPEPASLTIRNQDESYTEEYKLLTSEFYLGL